MALLVLSTSVVGSVLVAAAPPAAAAVTPVLKWQRAIGRVVESSPLAVDLDGDSRDDLVVGAWDGRVWALRGTDGADLPGWPRDTGQSVNSSPAVADTDGDGRPEVFVGTGTAATNQGAALSFEHDGTQRFRFSARDEDHAAPAVHSTPAVGDVRPDGSPDATFGTLGVRGIWSLNQVGGAQPGFPLQIDDSVFSSAALADVDNDGVPEAIIGGDSSPGGPVDHRGGMVRAVKGDGRIVWEFRINEIVRSSPSVGDIDGDGSPEIVFGAGDFWNGSDATKVFALSLDGRLKAGWPQNTDGLTIGSPALADLDGDGRLDVVIGTDIRSADRGTVWAWNGSGGRLNGYPRPFAGGRVIGSIVTADVDGDGGQDPIVPGRGVFAYSGKTGVELFSVAAGRAAFQSSPVVADVDGNGLLDLLLAGDDARGGGLAFRYELPAPARLGTLGWHQFRRDDRRTGSWTTAAQPVPRDIADACPPGRVSDAGFSDVPEGSTHDDAIDCVAAWGVTQGSGGGYRPTVPVNREQMAAFVARLIERSGGSLPSSPPDAFRDDESSSFELAINQLAAAGIVSGRGDGTYGPGERVTRAQMATFLVRAYEYRAGTRLAGGPDAFIDDFTSTHHGAINTAAAAGFTGGSPYGSYRPLVDVARDGMASFLARVLDRLVQEGRATVPF